MKCLAQEGRRAGRLLFAESADAEEGIVLDRARRVAFPVLVANATRSGYWRDFDGDEGEALAELDEADLQPRADT